MREIQTQQKNIVICLITEIVSYIIFTKLKS